MVAYRTGWIICIALLLSVGLRVTAEEVKKRPFNYDYPLKNQEYLRKQDSKRNFLTDGRNPTEGTGIIYGAWNRKNLVIDWSFNKPTRIRAFKLSIVHPFPDSSNSHPGRVKVFGSDGKADFLIYPDIEINIPFKRGKLQQIRLPFPGKGVAVKRLRIVFESAKHQTALCEVAFEAEPTTDKDIRAAQSKRQAGQPPVVKSVKFLPLSTKQTTRPPAKSMFGVCGHMLHTDFFYPKTTKEKFSPYWRPEYTLPLCAGGSFRWVKEPIYGSLFFGKGKRAQLSCRTYKESRKLIDGYLTQYDRAGIRVWVLAYPARPAQSKHTQYFLEWLAEMAKKHPCIGAVEIGGEMNLHKLSPEDFALRCRWSAKILKKNNAKLPVYIGGFSGWGQALKSDKWSKKARGRKHRLYAYAEQFFRAGVLDDTIDGVSTHPYRQKYAPEGGVGIESQLDPRGFEKEIAFWWSMVQKFNVKKLPLKLAFSEIGYSSGNVGNAVAGSLKRQADYLSRLKLILFNVRLQGIPLEVVLWYDLKCDETDSNQEANFGLVSRDTAIIRPAYVVYRRIVEMFNKPEAFKTVNTKAVFSNWPGVIKSYIWKHRSDNALIVTFWRMNQLQSKNVNFASELHLKLPKGFKIKRVELHDLHGDRPRNIGYRLDRELVCIPLWVTDRAAWIVIKQDTTK